MENKYQKGWEKLREIDGELGEAVVASLADIAPDLARYIVEFSFGDIYSRPGLSSRQRQIATIASLATQGGCEPQLEIHINASLNVGLTPNEIIEVFLHCCAYVGFPKVLNAVKVAQKVFKNRGVKPEWN